MSDLILKSLHVTTQCIFTVKGEKGKVAPVLNYVIKYYTMKVYGVVDV
jgi:hypothetical protein